MMEQREILTIGYGGRATDDFIALLQRYKIEALVDVRTQPYSKFNPDFTRAQFSKILTRAGINYIFMGDSLGGRPDDEDCFVAGKLNAARCEERDWYQRGIDKLKTLTMKRRVAIMCSELDPGRCHRFYVIGRTLSKDENSIVIHIDRAGGHLSHNELEHTLEAKEKPTQQSLF